MKATGRNKKLTWSTALRVGVVGITAATLMLVGVACTRNDMDAGDGTVADSNVGSVTSDVTDRDTERFTTSVTAPETDAPHTTTPDTIIPGTMLPGTDVPGTDVPGTGEWNTHDTDAPAETVVPGTTNGTTGNGARRMRGKG